MSEGVRTHAARALRALHAQRRSPLAWILLAICVVHVAGIGWGLPASDGWDNDGFAPRGFLQCLANTFTSGHYDTYPPVHATQGGISPLATAVAGLIGGAALGAGYVASRKIDAYDRRPPSAPDPPAAGKRTSDSDRV